jgi:hypothetical protein
MNQIETAIPDALFEAHRTLRSELRHLRNAIRSVPADHPGDIASQMEVVRSDLWEHFRFEEENGYMSSVVQLRPHLTRAVEQLREEHTELMRSLVELISEARSTTHLNAAFRDRLSAWLVAVGRHEQSENLLVHDAFNLDIEAED